MYVLVRGKRYPAPVPITEGAIAEFLLPEGNTLLIKLPGMDAEEEWALRKGNMEAGLLYDDASGHILWLFRFFGRRKKPVLTLDATFDARHIPKDRLALPDIERPQSQRLAILIIALDENDIVRGLREITLPPALSLAFLEAVQDQLAKSKASGPDPWSALPLNVLEAKARMYPCGLK